MENSVQLYGHQIKSDFSGHDIVFSNDLSIFGAGGDQYQPLVPGFFNTVRGCTLLAAADGEALMAHVCPNASDWPRVTDTRVLSPTGAVTVCGGSFEAWRARVPGVLGNVSSAPIPGGLTAEGVVQMARDTLSGVGLNPWP